MKEESFRAWQEWWDNLPETDREKMTSYEQEIGTRLTWEQRFLMLTPNPGK